MKIVLKLLLITSIIICMNGIFSENIVRAGDSSEVGKNLESITISGDTGAASGLRDIIGKLLGFLRIASGLVAVLMIAITGFNYIVGGAEVKKEMKEKMFPIILGLIIVFGAVTITTFVMGVL